MSVLIDRAFVEAALGESLPAEMRDLVTKLVLHTATDIARTARPRAFERLRGHCLEEHEVAGELRRTRPPIPAHRPTDPRGIVICAGGQRYLKGAWIVVDALRRHGCRLPIEIWALDRDELPPAVEHAFRDAGVECVLLDQVRAVDESRSGGWELKVHAVARCGFEQVLLVDADNLPLGDPTLLFDDERFGQTGAIFWPDREMLSPSSPMWGLLDIEYRSEREFESGQLLVDRGRSASALTIASFFADESDFFFRRFHGDKEAFHFAWLYGRTPYHLIDREPLFFGSAVYQKSFDGALLFQHRCVTKWDSPLPEDLLTQQLRALGDAASTAFDRLWTRADRATGP